MLRRDVEPTASEQERRIGVLLRSRARYPSTRRFLAALLDALPAEETLEDGTVTHIARALRGIHDHRFYDDVELVEHSEFWYRLSYNFPESAYARACYADILAATGDDDAALLHFADAFDAKPTLLFEFGVDVFDPARSAGGDTWLRYQLACLRAALDGDDQPDEHDDFVRELYSELLAEYRDDPEAMRRILLMGAQLRDLEAEDKLPRAIVRRGAWRK